MARSVLIATAMNYRTPTSVILALVGPEAAGKSSHAETLAAALRARGIPATPFHHPPPPPEMETPFARALWYWQQRIDLGLRMCREAPQVIVADRWWESTRAYAVVQPHDVAKMMLDAVEHEIDVWAAIDTLPRVECILLDAPDAVLDARTRARGAEASAIDLHPRTSEMRAWYRNERFRRKWRRVNTSPEREAVCEDLLNEAAERLWLYYGWRPLNAPLALDFDANGAPV